ncbi:methyltransferase domain-containing protein [Alphaproteobacteria bacterium GH1-50]|uniref:Methyltransferase domain-containing protein n=1 Tax=Kangsaoukella pontilimi TaxID=2691042 RepID=A0A7C9IFT7_9RHOB|nr:methyltransferase domain-containing protein [Kangsaoukella pontilimi]MXQ07804.1 methyltransferase domain-containing protein [Kangsaoukella pontilimi]
MSPTYDTIGKGYATKRRPDPRIGAIIDGALGSARRVVNVGAGTGSYEPADREVTAVEPSAEMIGQRPPGAAPAIRGYAENLPFEDDAFDAAMSVLSLHHWTDKARGCAEMRRVATGPVVLLTFDPAFREAWLIDYFPEFAEQDDRRFPPMEAYEEWLGPVETEAVPIPHDCVDGFLYAYWRRPEVYLEAKARAAMSSFWALEDASPGLARLADDLDSGAWHARNGALLDRETCDLGYRLVRTV